MSGPPPGLVPVLVPYAERFFEAQQRAIAPRLASLEGARIGLVNNGFLSTVTIHEAFQRFAAERSIEIVVERKKYWQSLEPSQIERFANETDAVVSGLCHTPPSTAWSVHDMVQLESRGIPTVTLVASLYVDLLGESATTEGMPDLRRVVFPYPMEGRPDDEVAAAAHVRLDAIVAALTATADPDPISHTPSRGRP